MERNDWIKYGRQALIVTIVTHVIAYFIVINFFQ